jgi:hypothetical protein
MTPGDECALVRERLVDAPNAAIVDPAVAAHLGSCLDCFRVLADLREAPRIAELLRSEDPVPSEPGAGFWDALAARTMEAAEAARARPATRSSARIGSWRGWARDLGRRPGAMLVGAAAAVAVIGALGGWPSRVPAPNLPHEASATRGSEELGGGDGFDESSVTSDVSALEAPELRRLLDGLRRGEPDEIDAWFESGSDDEAGVADEISGLDVPALKRLARALGGSTL